jgi:hypothetical protein
LDGASLLNFVDAPILVGDPEGRVVYVNPSFERRFDLQSRDVQGELLAALFDGGAREAMLKAVAEVCDGAETVRFRMRADAVGYLALVSPIENEADRLGVIILLTDEPLADERLLAFYREMQEPLDELQQWLEQLVDQTGGRRDERHRELVENGLRAVDRARKWGEEIYSLLSGRGSKLASGTSLDPVEVVRRSASRVRPEFEQAGVVLDLIVPAKLAPARGDGARLEAALVQLLRQRLTGAERGDEFTLGARKMGEGPAEALLISVVGPPREGEIGDELAQGFELPIVRDTVSALGGRVHTYADLSSGSVTAIQLDFITPS